MELGIIGLPRSGKTTVFNLVSGQRPTSDHGAAGAAEISRAQTTVPDPRLGQLAELFQPKKVTPATVHYIDVPGIAKGTTTEGGMGARFLAQVKNADALVHVVRGFPSPSVAHPEGSVDPVRDVALVETELILHDLELVSGRVQRLHELLKKAKAPKEAKELEVLLPCLHGLENEIPIREAPLSAAQQAILRGFQLFTAKPLLVVLTLASSQVQESAQLLEQVMARFEDSKAVQGLWLFGRFEQELSALDPAEAAVFLADLGLTQGGFARFLQSSYSLLGLLTFFTYLRDEVRAWPLRRGSTALEAAGKVHTDIARGFIKAEVVHFSDLKRHGSVAEARKAGKVQLEGKNYQVRDGDVITFRFNV